MALAGRSLDTTYIMHVPMANNIMLLSLVSISLVKAGFTHAGDMSL